MRLAYVKVFLFIGLLIAGCAITEPKWMVPLDARNIYIGPFVNRTDDSHFDEELRALLITEFTVEGTLGVVDNEDDADLSLYGHIQTLINFPLAWDEYSVPYRYRTRMTIDVMLYNNKTGDPLWTTHDRLQLTPTPIGGTPMDYDSLNYRSIELFVDYDNFNTPHNVPVSDPDAVRLQLMEMAKKRILERVFTGF